MSIRITKAEAKREGLSGRILFPKPGALCKHRWGLAINRVDGKLIAVQKCRLCEGTKEAKQRSALRKISAKKRDQLGKLGWKDLRRRVYEMCRGICFWCGKPSTFEEGTIEHADPRGPDHEVNYNWVHHLPFMGSCHDRKARTACGILAAMRVAAWRCIGTLGDGTAENLAAMISLRWPTKSERMECLAKEREAQAALARQIDSGAIKSRLPA